MDLTLVLAIGVFGTAVLAGRRGFHFTARGRSLVLALIALMILIIVIKITTQHS